MKLIILSKYVILLLLVFLIINSQSLKASELFLEDFEYEIIPISYSTYLEADTSILLTDELQYSGEKSLKLTNTNPDGSCNIIFPVNIEYSGDLVIDFYQYFEESEPFYWIGVRGISNGIVREFILEYGNPYSDWIENSVYLVRGFNIPQKNGLNFPQILKMICNKHCNIQIVQLKLLPQLKLHFY